MLKPLHVCAEPECAELCAGTYCVQHTRAERYVQREPDTRPTANARGYDYQWQQTREAFLRRYPWCMAEGCGERATVADHIIPRAQGGTSDWENLQALCKAHHDRKTRAENSAGQG